jgi:uncharacterized membrane protein
MPSWAKTIDAEAASGAFVPSTYILVKFLHVTLAVLVGGTSASLGIWLEFMTRNAQDRAVVLRGIHRLLLALVIPGLVVQGLLGVRLVSLGSWTWDLPWLRLAVAVWVVLMVAVVASDVATRRLLQAHASGDEPRFVAWFRASRLFGATSGAAFLTILYLMVSKG